MECTDKTGRFREMLLDFAEKRLSPSERAELAAHLTRCEHCRASLTDIHQFLYAASFMDKKAWGGKSPCPSSEELVSLSESRGGISRERLDEIKKHLLECFQCNDQLRKLMSARRTMEKDGFAETAEMPDRLKSALKRVITDKVRSGAASGEPVEISFSPLAGQADARACASATGRKPPAGQDSVPVLDGRILGSVSSPSGEPVPREWVELVRNNRRLCRVKTTRRGTFRFEKPVQGFYEIRIRDHGTLVIVRKGGRQ